MEDVGLSVLHMLTFGVVGVTTAVIGATIHSTQAPTSADWLLPLRHEDVQSISSLVIQPGKVYTISGFCSADECQHIIGTCESGRRFERSMVGNESGRVHAGRTSTTCQLHNDSFGPIVSRAARLFGVGPAQVEGLQVARYERGQEYKEHHDFFNDGAPDMDRTKQRMGTIVVYLNSDFADGETSFPKLGVKKRGQQTGDALVWKNCDITSPTGLGPGAYDEEITCFNNTLHAGTPPSSGVKYVLTVWIHFPPASTA